MARSRRGSSVKKGLKFFVWGKEGTWKSSFCLDALRLKREDGKPMRVAYIDTEGGSVDNYLEDLEAEGINLDNLYLIYTSSYKEVEEYIEKLTNEDDLYLLDDKGEETEELVLDEDGNKFIADFIVLDSASVLKDTLTFGKIEVSEIRAKLKAKSREATASEQFVAESTAGMELKDYNKLSHQGKHLLQSLITKTDKYVAVTSRHADLKQNQKVNGNIQSVVVGEKPDCFNKAEYEFFTVLKMFEDEDGSIKAKVMRKDRTKVFAQNEIIEEPSIMYWQQVIESNKNKKSAPKMEDYNKTVDKEIDNKTKDLQRKSEETEKVKEVSNESSELYDELLSIREGLDSNARRKLTTEFKKNKLPARPAKDMEKELLEKMLEVAKAL